VICRQAAQEQPEPSSSRCVAQASTFPECDRVVQRTESSPAVTVSTWQSTRRDVRCTAPVRDGVMDPRLVIARRIGRDGAPDANTAFDDKPDGRPEVVTSHTTA
jgi:hypothetical protein